MNSIVLIYPKESWAIEDAESESSLYIVCEIGPTWSASSSAYWELEDAIWLRLTNTCDRETPSSTTQEIAADLQRAIGLGKHEHFEDGMQSAFAVRIQDLVRKHGCELLVRLGELIMKKVIPERLAGEALSALGALPSTLLYHERRALLENSLSDSALAIRYGALAGLERTCSASAVRAIRHAAETESNARLRDLMESIAVDLEQHGFAPDLTLESSSAEIGCVVDTWAGSYVPGWRTRSKKGAQTSSQDIEIPGLAKSRRRAPHTSSVALAQ